jgi:uncharacterized damage-inducible protein DinB
MTPENAAAVRDFLLAQLERESSATRSMIGAIPGDRADYRLHPRAMSARELAWHIAEAEPMLLEALAARSYASIRPLDPPLTDLREILAWHQERLPRGLEAMRRVPGDVLAAPLSFFGVDAPLVEHLAYVPKHSIHHRGQLSACLRAAGAFVPGMYGWSRDEREQAAAAAP